MSTLDIYGAAKRGREVYVLDTKVSSSYGDKVIKLTLGIFLPTAEQADQWIEETLALTGMKKGSIKVDHDITALWSLLSDENAFLELQGAKWTLVQSGRRRETYIDGEVLIAFAHKGIKPEKHNGNIINFVHNQNN
jgi:hypothetical protein